MSGAIEFLQLALSIAPAGNGVNDALSVDSGRRSFSGRGRRWGWTIRVRRIHAVYRYTVTLCVHALNIMKIVVLLHTISGSLSSISGRKAADYQARSCSRDCTVTAMNPCSNSSTDYRARRGGSCTGPVYRVGMCFVAHLFMRKLSARIVVGAELIQSLIGSWQSQNSRCFRKCDTSPQQ